jgi:hypothetical protein
MLPDEVVNGLRMMYERSKGTGREPAACDPNLHPLVDET